MEGILSLDWRDAPKSSEIMARSERFFTEVDKNEGTRMRLHRSTGKAAITMGEINGNTMILRRNFQGIKRYTGQELYWQRALMVGMGLHELQATQLMVKIRFFKYKNHSPEINMSLDEVERLVHDLALTIEVHPLGLGICTEERGKFFLPQHSNLRVLIVENVIGWRNGDHTSKSIESLRHTYDMRPIPQAIEKLEFSKLRPMEISAVVVTEHANLSSLLINKKFGASDKIVVATSGYPSGPTLEFLHMLAKDPMFKKTPFVFLSDHDFEGIHIFSIIKYGSRLSAYASAIQTVPQLQWMGPSLDDLMQSPELFLPDWENQYRADHPNAHSMAVREAGKKWKRKMDKRLKGKLFVATTKDRAMYKGFERSGWLENEPVVQAELKAMLRKPSKFRTADLTQISNGYIHAFVQSKVTQMIPTIAGIRSKAAEVVASPTRKRFMEISDQAMQQEVEAEAEAPAISSEYFSEQIAADISMMR